MTDVHGSLITGLCLLVLCNQWEETGRDVWLLRIAALFNIAIGAAFATLGLIS